jgi:YidC/Oxa1 family membrane protein insertase
LDRNLLLAFALSFLVLYTFSALQQPVETPGGAPTTTATDAERTTPGTPAAPGESAPPRDRYADLPSGPEAPPETTREVAPPSVTASAETFEITRNDVRVRFTTLGGAIESWELLRYTDPDGDYVVLVEPDHPAGPAALTPFSALGLGDLARENWSVLANESDRMTFGFSRDGVQVRKTYSFDPEGYQLRIALEVENGGSKSLTPRFLVSWPARAREENDFKEQYLTAWHDGEDESELVAGFGTDGWFSAATPHSDYPGEIDWAGVQATYFLSALIPDSPTQANARFSSITAGSVSEVQLFYDPVQLPPGQRVSREVRVYVGPKEAERLAVAGASLDGSISLGWWPIPPLAKGFGWLLEALHSIIPNYGIAIILLTLGVRIVTTPLTMKQMKSMERLRRIQPQMKALQEKHADDRQKQSEELMALYKREGVNPLGGCFPMLLQLPVFIGLFYALRSSIHLRHAPFFGWINDLSAPDELFVIPGMELPVRVLPLIMGGTMFLQQKITPMQTPDPAQARMMMTVMPVMMTVLFYQFASGLVLYWMMSNVLAIAHQLWTGRNLDKEGGSA